MPPKKRNGAAPASAPASVAGPPDHPRTAPTIDPQTEFKTLSGYPFDDIGNGKRLTAVFGKDMRYIKEYKVWAVWDGDWKMDDQLAMNLAKRTVEKMQRESVDDSAITKEKKSVHEKNPKSRAYIEAELEHSGATRYGKWAAVSASVGKLHAMMETASSEPGMTASALDFDNDPAILNCANGILELREDGKGVTMRAKDQGTDNCLLSTRVPFDPKAVSVHWDEYLDTFFPDKDVRYWVQKLAGASLFGRNSERMFVFGWGETTSGKGMFMNALELALGDYAGPFPLTVLRDNQDERPRADLIQALPRRMVFADEASGEWKLHADQVKRVTGDGTISARAPHAPRAVERTPSFVPWLFCNHIPEIRGRDKAIDKRIVVAPFQVSLKEDDPSYKRRMFSDRWLAPAVLAWLAEGWRNYTVEGLVNTDPIDVMVAKQKLLAELSDVDMFINQVCETGDSHQEAAASLFEVYERWADLNGMHGRDRMTGVQFGRALSGRGFVRKTIRSPRGAAQSGRLGIRISKSWKG